MAKDRIDRVGLADKLMVLQTTENTQIHPGPAAPGFRPKPLKEMPGPSPQESPAMYRSCTSESRPAANPTTTIFRRQPGTLRDLEVAPAQRSTLEHLIRAAVALNLQSKSRSKPRRASSKQAD
jgi:hypothetical protein